MLPLLRQANLTLARLCLRNRQGLHEAFFRAHPSIMVIHHGSVSGFVFVQNACTASSARNSPPGHLASKDKIGAQERLTCFG